MNLARLLLVVLAVLMTAVVIVVIHQANQFAVAMDKVPEVAKSVAEFSESMTRMLDFHKLYDAMRLTRPFHLEESPDI